MKLFWALLTLAIGVALFAHGAKAQSAPGWIPTGEWQCGPHVRVVVSTDGRDGLDFLVIGAWFDNHYTVRRGQLFYNAIPCAAIGKVWPWGPKRQTAKPEQSSDQRCNDSLSMEDREKYCE
jgi:hypothetical protein